MLKSTSTYSRSLDLLCANCQEILGTYSSFVNVKKPCGSQVFQKKTCVDHIILQSAHRGLRAGTDTLSLGSNHSQLGERTPEAENPTSTQIWVLGNLYYKSNTANDIVPHSGLAQDTLLPEAEQQKVPPVPNQGAGYLRLIKLLGHMRQNAYKHLSLKCKNTIIIK